jgi:transposase
MTRTITLNASPVTNGREGSRLVTGTRAGRQWRCWRGLERCWFDAVMGDRGYTSAAVRAWLAKRMINAVIPSRLDEHDLVEYDHRLYRERNMVERTINGLNRYQRIATRYENLARRYQAMPTIACILEWI